MWIAARAFAGDAHQALRRKKRRFFVAPDRVRGRIAGNAQLLAGLEPFLVLGMKGGAPPRLGKDRGNALVVGDEQRACRRAHKDLDAGSARQAFEFRNVRHIVVRCADPEGEIAMHPMRRALHLIGETRRLGRGRIGIRHVENGGEAAQYRGA